MTEQELIIHFVDFLTSEKGYPRNSILVEASLGDKKTSPRRYVADLILLDTDYNNYLALLEFKREGIRATRDALYQVKAYLDVMGQPNLPAYLVLPNSKNETSIDFLIYILDNNDWRQIEKRDFPIYETLRSKNQADEKREFRNLDEIKVTEIKKKKELIRDTAWSALTSLVAGIAVVLVLSKTLFFKDLLVSDNPNVVCCDSIVPLREKLNNKIALLEKSLIELRHQDSVIRVDGNKIEFSKLNSRVTSVENIINQTPEKLLQIQEVTFQIKELNTKIESEKELSDTKLTNLKDRIDQLTIWTSGLIITIIGSIIGFAVNAFRKS